LRFGEKGESTMEATERRGERHKLAGSIQVRGEKKRSLYLTENGRGQRKMAGWGIGKGGGIGHDDETGKIKEDVPGLNLC